LIANGIRDRAQPSSDSHIETLAQIALASRKELVALSRAYAPLPSDNELAGLHPSDQGAALLAVARLGWRLHSKFFGLPDDTNVPDDLRRFAELLRDAGDKGNPTPRLQLDAEALPFPWAILYDAPDEPQDLASVDVRRFWGRRFSIDRVANATLRRLPSRLLGTHVQPCINPRINAEQGSHVLANQRKFFADRQAASAIETDDGLCSYLKGAEVNPALLYFFCHAKAPAFEEKLFSQGPVADDDAFFLLLDNEAGEYQLSVRHLQKARSSPIPTQPLVFLNACSSAEADSAYQSPFLKLFIGSWQARGLVGTDWKIPTLFADAFGRRLLARFLEPPYPPLGVAMHDSIAEVMELKNPFPLIYALYARPELRVAE
jgi:hypothetical protein